MGGYEPKKLALLRIWQILKENSDCDHPLTQEEIGAYLERDYGIEIERKAISRNLSLLREAGIESESNREGSYLESREFEAAVVNDEVASAQENIHGVPYFIIAGKYAVPGAMPVDAMKELLQKVYEQERTPEEIIAATAGSACGPDGCSF